MAWKLSISRRASLPRIAAAAIAIAAAAVFCQLELAGNPSSQLPNPPELRAKNHTLSLTLRAGITKDGKNSFYFDGQPNAPTLRLSPGDQLKINYINDLPAKPQESCAITPCMDMTNLHFHGLTVSPDAPQDDVLCLDNHSATPCRFRKTIRRACIGITRILMGRATDKRLTACPERL